MMAGALQAVLVREAKIRATNLLFIFWDVVYPLGYLLVFGIGVNASLGFTSGLAGVDYNAFFLAGVLGMASFGIAANTSWSFFLDRDNGIFFEMLTYPMRRSEYLLGKVLFNVLVGLVQALLTLVLAAVLLHVPIRVDRLPLLVAATIVGTAGWFFFYAIFALRIRRNDAFNTVTSVFYFVFLFASSMFYPLDPLPRAFRLVALANPITWQIDVLRYSTIGVGGSVDITIEAAAFVVFTLASFVAAIRALRNSG
jgi:ABC-type multidrug transport system permease subunit